MKEEKEVKWILCLYDSPYVKDIIELKGIIKAPKSACKKDFERLVEAPEKSKEFSDWFKKLLDFGVFVFAGRNARGYRNNIHADEYTVNALKLARYFKDNPLYPKAVKFFDRGRII